MILCLFVTIGHIDSKKTPGKSSKHKRRKHHRVSESEGLSSSNENQEKRQQTRQQHQQTREQTREHHPVETVRVSESEGMSSSNENQEMRQQTGQQHQQTREQTREQEISILHEQLKNKMHFATPHGQNQKVLQMYQLRGGGDATAGILNTVETENIPQVPM